MNLLYDILDMGHL